MIVLGVSSCMWACGDDDDDTGPTGGSAGKAGSSTGGSGGKAGSSNGGNAGKGGSTAGSAGKGGNGGTDLGGAGGTDLGGDAGSGGTPGGAGGAAGAGGSVDEVGGAGAGGMAGAGGDTGSTLTQAEACQFQCDAFFTAHPAECPGYPGASEADCTTSCTAYTDIPDKFLTYVQCVAEKLTASDLECGDSSGGSLMPMWPVAAGACETELCDWTCADAAVTDAAVFTRCGC